MLTVRFAVGSANDRIYGNARLPFQPGSRRAFRKVLASLRPTPGP
jgi:hypothetical protein